VDRVDAQARESGNVRGHHRDLEGIRERSRRILVDIANRDDLDKVEPAQSGDVIAGDVAGADQRDAQFAW